MFGLSSLATSGGRRSMVNFCSYYCTVTKFLEAGWPSWATLKRLWCLFDIIVKSAAWSLNGRTCKIEKRFKKLVNIQISGQIRRLFSLVSRVSRREHFWSQRQHYNPLYNVEQLIAAVYISDFGAEKNRHKSPNVSKRAISDLMANWQIFISPNVTF